MISIPITDSISTHKTIQFDKMDASPNFSRFRVQKHYQNNNNLDFKISKTITASKVPVAFGSSQERKKSKKLVLPSLYYDLNFNSVDRHKASPKLRTNRTHRIKSEVTEKCCNHVPLSINRTETITQSIQQTKLNYLQKLIQRVKTPKQEQQSKVQLKQDEYIPMNSQQLQESLVSLMYIILYIKAQIWIKKIEMNRCEQIVNIYNDQNCHGIQIFHYFQLIMFYQSLKKNRRSRSLDQNLFYQHSMQLGRNVKNIFEIQQTKVAFWTFMKEQQRVRLESPPRFYDKNYSQIDKKLQIPVIRSENQKSYVFSHRRMMKKTDLPNCSKKELINLQQIQEYPEQRKNLQNHQQDSQFINKKIKQDIFRITQNYQQRVILKSLSDV